jgi:Protein of unknown function (DUF3631)
MTTYIDPDAIDDLDGEQLLEDVWHAIARYCVLPGDHEYIAVTLWCAYTHFADVFDFAPRLVIRSPQKRSGKTRLLEAVSEMVHAPLKTINASSAYIFRSLDQGPRTLIFDEVDGLFGTRAQAERNDDLRSMLNAGYQRGATIGRTVGPNHETKEFPTFAPAALAGIGELPDTIEDRAAVIKMRPRIHDEKVEPYRIGRDQKGLNDIRDRLARWAASVHDDAQKYAAYQNVDVPVDDRAADVWEPLLIVAELAGGNWPLVAREACKEMCAQATAEDGDYSPGQQLLFDIREVFGSADFLGSTELVYKLKDLHDSPWGDEMLTPARLASKLGKYDIRPRPNHSGKLRGYYRPQFRDAWKRYLPEKPSEPSEPSEVYPDLHQFPDTSPLFDDAPDTLPSEEPSDAEEPSEENLSSDGVSDTSDTSDGSTEGKAPTPLDALVARGGKLPLAGNLTPEQQTRVQQALARAQTKNL